MKLFKGKGMLIFEVACVLASAVGSIGSIAAGHVKEKVNKPNPVDNKPKQN